MFQASTLARTIFLVSMRLARMLGCLATRSFGQLDIPSLRYWTHGLEYCMLSFYFIWLPAATRLDPFAR
jgi:hypothetical protein